MFRVLNCLGLQHDWRLVVLAVVVCFFVSAAAVSLYNRARMGSGRARFSWLLTASFATGAGIWATHFIAMLAFNFGYPVTFDIGLTLLSLLVAIVVTGLGLSVAVYGEERWSSAAGGAFVGSGIACMHYLGVTAVLTTGETVWTADLVVASIVLGIVFGAAALQVMSRRPSPRVMLAGASLLSLAIITHHFTGMSAAGIIPAYIPEPDPNALGPASLATIVAVVAAAVLGICMIGVWSDQHGRELISERNQWLDAAVNNMIQGLCLFDEQNRLMVWNERYRAMYNIPPDKIWRGCTVRDLLDARIAARVFPLDPAGYMAELDAALTLRKAFTLNIELADGRIIHVINQPTESGGWVATHEDITERQRAEKDLENTRAFLNTIIENVPSPIVVKAVSDRRVVLVNRAAETYFGIKREAMLGKVAKDFMPAGATGMIDVHDQRLVDSGQPVFFDEHVVSTPGNGTRIATATRLPLFGPDGKPQYLVSVIDDVTDRKRDEQRIAHMASHDTLTDLPNRAAFNSCIASTVELAAASGESFAVLNIDLDHFKTVNDVFGHTVGDELLRETARRMETVCQGAFLARTGGDEFVVVSPTGQQPAVAETLAARLTTAFNTDLEVQGHLVRIGLTIGVAIFPQDGTDTTALVANADAALFRAKAEARGTVRFFEVAMDNQLREKRALHEDLRLAIQRDELEVYYQPQALIDGSITGFEALVRWNHPRHGMVPPSTFIPLAEENGSIVALGERVLRTACREAASWPRPLSIAINLSPIQFQHGDLPNLVHEVLIDTGLAPKRLELEITEGVLIGDFTRAVGILRRLKNLGVRTAMDDFGTGYSSLSYLQSFPFDKIKIDQTFIANINHSQQAATIIRAVVALGRGLGVPVLAEGVETADQLKFLAAEGCDEIQGYYIGRPLRIADYAEMVGRVPNKPKLKVVGKKAWL
ncbi:MAG TPA: EAL domain-containing protein [Pseudolabrys sp.]|jgi:diguanylate cyclase (GGDEF)-like protein/PAS domain S-box-containing protein